MSNPSRSINPEFSSDVAMAEMRLIMAIYSTEEEIQNLESYALNILWAGATERARDLVRDYFKEIIEKNLKERE